MNLNKVFVIGRLTADPQVRSTPTGVQVASFGLATNRVWYDAQKQKQESTEFHNVVVWGRQAESVGKFLTKGSLILVEGRLQTRSWQDKSGQNRKTTEIIAERIQFGPRSSASGGMTGSREKPAPQDGGEGPAQEIQIPTINVDAEEDIKAEDLPF